LKQPTQEGESGEGVVRMNVYEYNPTTGDSKLWAKCETEEQATIVSELLHAEYGERLKEHRTRKFGTGTDEKTAMFIV
jgi:hypothetical protein